ncbi:hypothetical protein PTSG_10694 [Salpingoeca rosetta]|uniref:PH domain-containing protein n=1 Tax=Salpingoeca rosetta (strain ATCC 50818 / BSB-021) TaxID=946362 RepID=F2UQ41_SALR5|nr:uncharacterized protein PTSG_10694 [Salpingoeca rosetta]EGD79709.1 hypothetical protein PTSG_10694 [Salpingoeca rosetta]|eukprot:XP_004988659.1 hypothetical protein PTSG_10694 [Salpingoeca rosetta]
MAVRSVAAIAAAVVAVGSRVIAAHAAAHNGMWLATDDDDGRGGFEGHDHNPLGADSDSMLHSDPANCTVMCPTLMQSPQQWPLWVVMSMYAILLVLAVAVMRLSPLRSSRMVLLSMQVCLLVIRIFCYIVKLPWTKLAVRIVIIMLPIYLQFITFLLVATYILRMFVTIYVRYERRDRWLTVLNWVVVSVALLILGMDVGLFVYCSQADDPCGNVKEGFDHNLALFSALTFGFITLVLGASGVLARRVIRKCRNDSEESKRMLRIIFRVLVMYTCVFAGRSIWAITYAAGANRAQDYIAHLSRTNITSFYATSIAFFGTFEFGFGDDLVEDTNPPPPPPVPRRRASTGSTRSNNSDTSTSSNDSVFDNVDEESKPTARVVSILGQTGVGKSHLATWEVYGKRMGPYDESETIREVISVPPTTTTPGCTLIELGHDQVPEETRVEHYEHEIDNSNGFILMYDTTRRETYDLVKWVLTELMQRRSKIDWSCVVIANDFNASPECKPVVDPAEAQDLCDSFGVTFMQVQDICQPEHKPLAQVLKGIGGSHSMVGYLDKKGGGSSVLGRKNWKRRWFVLDDTMLTYRPTPDSPGVKGRIAIDDMEAVRDGDADKPQQFVLVAKKRELVMQAPTPDKKMMWVNKLTDVIQKRGRFKRSLFMSRRFTGTQRFSQSSQSSHSHI